MPARMSLEKQSRVRLRYACVKLTRLAGSSDRPANWTPGTKKDSVTDYLEQDIGRGATRDPPGGLVPYKTRAFFRYAVVYVDEKMKTRDALVTQRAQDIACVRRRIRDEGLDQAAMELYYGLNLDVPFTEGPLGGRKTVTATVGHRRSPLAEQATVQNGSVPRPVAGTARTAATASQAGGSGRRRKPRRDLPSSDEGSDTDLHEQESDDDYRPPVMPPPAKRPRHSTSSSTLSSVPSEFTEMTHSCERTPSARPAAGPSTLVVPSRRPLDRLPPSEAPPSNSPGSMLPPVGFPLRAAGTSRLSLSSTLSPVPSDFSERLRPADLAAAPLSPIASPSVAGRRSSQQSPRQDKNMKKHGRVVAASGASSPGTHDQPVVLSDDGDEDYVPATIQPLDRVASRAGAPAAQRLVRDRSETAAVDYENEQRYKRFLFTQPMHNLARVKAAWDQAQGDVRSATALLEKPVRHPWPTPPASVDDKKGVTLLPQTLSSPAGASASRSASTGSAAPAPAGRGRSVVKAETDDAAVGDPPLYEVPAPIPPGDSARIKAETYDALNAVGSSRRDQPVSARVERNASATPSLYDGQLPSRPPETSTSPSGSSGSAVLPDAPVAQLPARRFSSTHSVSPAPGSVPQAEVSGQMDRGLPAAALGIYQRNAKTVLCQNLPAAFGATLRATAGRNVRLQLEQVRMQYDERPGAMAEHKDFWHAQALELIAGASGPDLSSVREKAAALLEAIARDDYNKAVAQKT